MSDDAHDLQFSILEVVSRCAAHPAASTPYLESLVLQYSFDSGVFPARRQFGLEYNTEGAIADDFALCILHFSFLPGHAVLDLFANYFCENVSAHRIRQCSRQLRSAIYSPPIRKLEKTPPARLLDIADRYNACGATLAVLMFSRHDRRNVFQRQQEKCRRGCAKE